MSIFEIKTNKSGFNVDGEVIIELAEEAGKRIQIGGICLAHQIKLATFSISLFN